MGLALVLGSLFYFVALQMQIQACNGCLEKERIGLLEIKAYFVAHSGDIAESELVSWVDDRASNCCSWDRIKCANISTRHVTELSLNDLHYSMKASLMLNVSLFRPFEELLSLDLSGNECQDLIDNEGFSSFKKLETLDLSSNDLNTSILPSLNRLTSLRTLKLNSNSMDGSFPAQGFSSLKKLETLDLSGNNLNTSILTSLNGLTSLRTLKLNSNSMDGSFPAQGLSSLKKLETLDLSVNSLNSSVLSSLNGFTSLQSLKLNSNSMNGSFSAQDFVHFSRLELLDVSFNGLNGTLSSEGLQNLKSLKVLDLSENQLIGSIQGLCKMKDLTELVLSSNMFGGQLPECLNNLTNLHILDLSNNLFIGHFPSFTGNLTSLAYLSLFGNYLQGSFSLNTLANHSKLQVLYISSQSPRAQIETQKTQWFPKFQLKFLMLRNCNLNMDKGSTIPSFLLYQHDLQFIDLSHNKLVGGFPSWLIKNNSRLKAIFFSNNSFAGILQLSSIRQEIYYLDISNNNISGVLPKDIGNILPEVSYLNLSMNIFEGNIPASIGEMKKLWSLDLSHNHFSGAIPKRLATDCIRLEQLKLSSNFLEGNILKFSYGSLLQALYLNSNNFSGTLKEVLSGKNTGLEVLDISNNSISGAIPSSIEMFSSMRILLMAANQLEGEVPLGFSNISGLEMLDLSQNRLFGSIPYFNLPSLRFLYLQKNALSGSIPFTLTKSSKLVTLDLRDNKLSGNIPFWIDKLPELRVLLLGGNNFYGHIPIQLCQLKNVTIMDISRNMINGSIPSCFENLSIGIVRDDDQGPNFDIPSTGAWIFYPGESFPSASVVLFPPISIINSIEDELHAAVEFRTKRNYYSYKGNILENMTGLDLSCNKLTGVIPSQIGNLQQIRALNLSHNNLSGSIPNTFSNLSQIESLDLSYNSLSGEIPSQLTQLNFLSIFNVSYNNLSGITPSTGQFATFDEDNYRGNPGLCGSLLKRKCEGAAASPPSESSNTGRKETAVDMVAFYWSFSAAYITILLGFVMVLYINAQWRMAWFYYMVHFSKITSINGIFLHRAALAQQSHSTSETNEMVNLSNIATVAAPLEKRGVLFAPDPSTDDSNLWKS